MECKQQQQQLLQLQLQLLLLLLHLSLSTPRWYMWEPEIYFHSFLTLVADIDAWSESHPWHFTPRNVHQHPLNMKLGVPQARLDNKNIFSPFQDLNSSSSSPQPGHSSNYSILAQCSRLSKPLLTTNCMKQGIFKKLPALDVAYPCSAVIKY